MIWQDECYLLSKTNYNENSTIINIFSLNHGNISGIVYGGSSRKQKRNFQLGNKITPMDALKDFGCFRLAAVVFDLRKEGHNIMKKVNGKKHATYYLKNENWI